jgi:hypothetical protein
MKVEPIVDKSTIIETLRRQYGLRIEHLDFLPHSWLCSCYVVRCADGARYFLKLYDVAGWAPFVATDLDFYLPLTHDLHARGILPNIAYPIPTQDGRFRIHFGDYLPILFNFIEGRTLGYGALPDDVLAKLARLIGILHRDALGIAVEHPHIDRFDVVFESALLRSLEELEGLTAGARKGKQELRNLLLPRKNELLGLLDRLKELRELVKEAGKPPVVCHTDLHGGNLMVDKRGELYIVDWEGAIIAPPEHDLFAFAGDDRFWDLFLPNYEREFGPASLHPDVFGFYFYRRNLEDLADFVKRILYVNDDDAQDQSDLHWLMEGCVAGWPHLETTIKKIGEQ